MPIPSLHRLMLLASVALTACTPPKPAVAPTAQVNDDPLLPPILEVVRDAGDPELYSIHVKPGLEGTAKVSILGSQPAKWINPPPEKGVSLRKGDAEQVYQLRLSGTPAPAAALASAAAAAPGASGASDSGARVQLTIFNSAGQAVLNVASPFPMPYAAPAGTPVPVVEGLNAEGGRVQSVIPPDAPAPQVAPPAQGSQP